MRHHVRYSLTRRRPETVIRKVKGDYSRTGFALFDVATQKQLDLYMNPDAKMAFRILSRRSRDLGYRTPQFEDVDRATA
ncbi:MAG: hypothetical protein ACOCYP_04845 [Planctomycetota bacterium]